MNSNDDFDAMFEDWLRGEAPSEAPDRVLNTALVRVAKQPQRRGWLARVQKGTRMARLVETAAIVAVIALAAFIGLRYTNLTPAVGGLSSPSPTDAATAAASTTPAPAIPATPTPATATPAAAIPATPTPATATPEPSIEPTPFTPPSARCPSPASQVRLPDVTVSVGGAPGVVASRGSSTTITCTTTGTQDVVPSDPTELLSATIGDQVELALPAAWGFLRVEGPAITAIDTPNHPSHVTVPVPVGTGEEIAGLNVWMVRDDGRVVGEMAITYRVRVR